MESYPIIELRLKHGQSFRGNSLWSRITESNTYEVYSYNTLVATKQLNTGESWVSPDKYSNTTSRGQNLIKRAWGLN
jgi:hypothetical protein